MTTFGSPSFGHLSAVTLILSHGSGTRGTECFGYFPSPVLVGVSPMMTRLLLTDTTPLELCASLTA